MGNRYADDIKRIVGTDLNRSSLGDAPERNPIGGKRGIGYFNPDSNSSDSTSGTPGAGGTQLGNEADTGGFDDPANNQGNNSPNPNDPLNNSFYDDTAGVSAADIIDGIAEEAKFGDPLSSDGGPIFDGPALHKITDITDCDTGQEMEIYPGDLYPAPEEIQDTQGNIISNAWEDPGTPPDIPGWTLGRYYNVSVSMTDSPEFDVATPVQAITDVFEAMNAQVGPIYGLPWEFRYIDYDNTNIIGYSASEDVEGVIGVWVELPCAGGEYEGNNTVCPLTNPKETMWPSDLKAILVLGTSGFEGHELDPDIPASYSTPVNLVDFCFGSGRSGRIEATRDGGFMIYETVLGAPTGIARVYNANNRVVAFGDANKLEWLRTLRPEPVP